MDARMPEDDADTVEAGSTLAERTYLQLREDIITVKLAEASRPQGIKEVVETMFIYYGPGVEVVMPEGFGD